MRRTGDKGIYRLDIGPSRFTSRHIGLVGRAEKEKSATVKRGACTNDAREQFNLIDCRRRVWPPIPHDCRVKHPVAVEEYSLPQPSRGGYFCDSHVVATCFRAG